MDSIQTYERAWPMMGSYLEVVFHGPDPETLEQAALAILQDAERLQQLLSRFDGESEISLINRLAAEHPVEVEPVTFGLLLRARHYWQETDGAFDITAGPLVDLWLSRPPGSPPSEAEIEAARDLTGFRKVLLDPEIRYVAFDAPEARLDVGGIGKGFAVDRAADIARGDGVWSGLISMGGSGIFALGPPPGETCWRIEVEHPLRRGVAVTAIELCDEALSSSGTRRRSLAALGAEPPPHIVDPRTGRLARGPIAATVVAPRAELADVLSTAVMILDRDESLALLRRYGIRQAILFHAEPGRIRWEALGPEGWTPAGEAEA